VLTLFPFGVHSDGKGIDNNRHARPEDEKIDAVINQDRSSLALLSDWRRTVVVERSFGAAGSCQPAPIQSAAER
jgi:hypothetical protein